MVRFERVFGDRAVSFGVIFVPISHSNKPPLVGKKGALRPICCIPVEGEPDYYRMEESEHDRSLDWLGTVSGPIVLSFGGNHWNRSVGLETEHVPGSDDRRLLENQFFGSNKVHRLRDTFLDHSFEYTSTNTRRSRSEGRGAAGSLLGTWTYGESDRRPFRLRVHL
jgi:hypothetical protein